MIETIEGIVLKQTEYKENDCIITILTESGKESLYARGIRKPTSKNSYACSSLMRSNFQFERKEKKIPVVLGARISENYISKLNDYQKIMIASIMCEIINEISDDQSLSCSHLYHILANAINALVKYKAYYLVFCLFLSDILNEVGVNLIVDECSGCSLQQINAISIEAGGFVCQKCLQHIQATQYDKEFLQKFRFVNKAEYEHIPKLLEFAPYQKQLVVLLSEFLVEYAGIRQKSFKFLKEFPDDDSV